MVSSNALKAFLAHLDEHKCDKDRGWGYCEVARGLAARCDPGEIEYEAASTERKPDEGGKG